MSGPTNVFIVCSPRPHTGKTLVARLLAEYCYSEQRSPSCFDLDPINPTLSGYLPSDTTRSSLTDTRGQVALFDKLVADDERPKIIDLSPLALEKFFTVAYDIGFAQGARDRGVSTVVMYIADEVPITLTTYNILREKLPAMTFVPVHNDGIARGAALRRLFPANPGGPTTLQIPQLSSAARQIIDQKGFSLVQFVKSPPIRVGRKLREEIETFARRLFRQLREAELALLINQLDHTLGENPRKTGTQ